MNRAIRITSTVIALYAGALALAHGYYETLQGDLAPSDVLIYAIGAPCQPDVEWHACLPALTLLPTMQLAGGLTLLLALALMLWALVFLPRKRGGLGLLALSVGLLLAGGGFFPAYFGILAGALGSRIRTSLAWWNKRLSGGRGRILALLYPWALVAFVGWGAFQWVFGERIHELLLSAGPLPILLDFVLLLLALLASIAHDVRRTYPTTNA